MERDLFEDFARELAPQVSKDGITQLRCSVIRMGDLLDFGQLFKALGKN